MSISCCGANDGYLILLVFQIIAASIKSTIFASENVVDKYKYQIVKNMIKAKVLY